MRHLRRTLVIIGLSIAALSMAGSDAACADPREAIDFGRQIQPILAKRCYSCHGPDQAEAGLRFDQQETVFQPLESKRHAVVAKDASRSELLRRVAATDDGERMPPEGVPLSEDQIDLLRRWIEQGAEWQEHWAFEQVARVDPPAVRQAGWIVNPIDAFILHKLEQQGLSPAPTAGKTALLRRVTYDLTGLPPTAAEVDAFLADDSTNAYERIVDRLLESERFGEHWARHWLDVVRYADTNSYERDGPKPHAWRYRDYVIRALNQDKPYDQFVREQLAGDELPDQTNDSLIATGFYRLGLWDDEPADKLLARYDGLDDIITTTTQGFLGLTVNCARCHDHKIDPISQRDYYSLLAFFQGVTPNGYANPNVERPIFADEAARRDFERREQVHRGQMDEVQAKLTAIETAFRELMAKRSNDVGQSDLDDLEYRFYRDTWEKLPDFDALKPETTAKSESPFFDLSPATREFSFGFVFTGMLKVPSDGEYTFQLDSDDGSRLTIAAEPLIVHDGIHGTGQPKTAKRTLKQGRTPIRLEYFQGPTGAKELIVSWSGPGFTSRPLSKTKDDKPQNLAAAIQEHGASLLGADRYREHGELTRQLQSLKADTPVPDKALCVTETGPNPPETAVLKRGNPAAPGEPVVPAFISVLGGGSAKIPTPPSDAKTSGRRLELANWIASPDNRLTARVMVNRLWQHHFGRGIVRSPNNFGLLGDRPTHPELLDWLAGRLIDEGWRLKPLHKLIVMSQSYRLSSTADTEALAKDPLNDLFWRHDMRRLTAEEIRDSILATAGKLNPAMYGPGVYPEISDEVKAGQSIPGQGWLTSSPEDQARRSIYIFVKRSLTFPILADFDFPDTDNSCPARFATTQPTQALGMLNGKFLNDEARTLAARLRTEVGDDTTAQVKLACRLALCRPPDERQVQRGLQLIETLKTKHQLSADQALDQFCLMVLNLNEFIYLD